jgi:uncharacterized protein YcfL
MEMLTTALSAAVTVLFLIGCSSEAGAYTLYRSSLVNDSLRVHVATFDAEDGSVYNRDNCEEAKTLFQSKHGEKLRYWCEMGTYRK